MANGYETYLVSEYFEKLKSVTLVSGTWHDEVETFKEYSQTAMSNTASLSTLAKNGWLQRKKNIRQR